MVDIQPNIIMYFGVEEYRKCVRLYNEDKIKIYSGWLGLQFPVLDLRIQEQIHNPLKVRYNVEFEVDIICKMLQNTKSK